MLNFSIEEEDDSSKETNSFSSCIDDFVLDYSNSSNLEEAEVQVICYVSGYIAQTLTRKVHHDCCKKQLVSNGIFSEIESNERNELIDLSIRGRLSVPSNDLVLLCLFAYKTFCLLKRNYFKTFLS